MLIYEANHRLNPVTNGLVKAQLILKTPALFRFRMASSSQLLKDNLRLKCLLTSFLRICTQMIQMYHSNIKNNYVTILKLISIIPSRLLRAIYLTFKAASKKVYGRGNTMIESSHLFFKMRADTSFKHKWWVTEELLPPCTACCTSTAPVALWSHPFTFL